MSDILQLIKERRTIRKYLDKPVSDELLNAVLESGRWAQSWGNTQCWQVVVVRDTNKKKELQKAVPSSNPSHQAIMDAPVVLCLCAKKKVAGFYKGQACTSYGDWMLFDIGVFAQNIALSAYHLGLGTVVVGLLDHDLARQIVGLSDDYALIALMPLGYPAKIPSTPPRKEIKDFTQHI
ncbi:MAG TPA: nitroreductase family protein [Candidatus Hydrogenedens sp.]|nr:nitroreductase family protein [Candidatus Hydrogenedens sp.]